jgi:23S rRNA pseudouridine2605 synthase
VRYKPARAPDSSRVARDGRARGRAAEGHEPERLQKVLARAGLASRREIEEWIRADRITVNGHPAVLGVRVGATDHIRLDGRLIRQHASARGGRVFLCHRSPGERLQHPSENGDVDLPEAQDSTRRAPVSGPESAASRAASAGRQTSTLLERIPRRAGRRLVPVSPMPRVDGGLELVTSDGDLASRLQRSMRNLASEFSVRVHGELSPEGLERILQGTLDTGERLAVERCEAAGGEGSNRWYALSARGASGKDVRQLFERQGALVSRVLRTQLGPLALDRHLSRGRFRELRPEELAALLATGGG